MSVSACDSDLIFVFHNLFYTGAFSGSDCVYCPIPDLNGFLVRAELAKDGGPFSVNSSEVRRFHSETAAASYRNGVVLKRNSHLVCCCLLRCYLHLTPAHLETEQYKMAAVTWNRKIMLTFYPRSDLVLYILITSERMQTSA